MTFTPFPIITPHMTGTRIAAQTTQRSSPTHTPGGIYTLTPAPSPPATITPALVAGTGEGASGEGTFFDPNAPAAETDALPIAPIGEDEGPSGPAIPEQSSVVVSYAGQIVPIISLQDGISAGPAIAQGHVFAMSRAGQIAAVSATGELAVNDTLFTISPASQFGLNENLNYGDLAWSEDGRYLAIRVDAINPLDVTSFESGIWIFEPATKRSWQIFRDTYEGEVEQLHEQRRARHVIWAPNSTVLAITVETPIGLGNVFLPVTHSANDWVEAIPYADATWTADSTALIVSGRTWDGPSVVGRIALDTTWSYTEYLNQNNTGLVMQMATQLHDGRIAFLGSTADSIALYAMPPIAGEQPVRLTAPITGQIIAAEWNEARTAVLVTINADSRQQLWIAQINGTTSNVTLPDSHIDAAHWR